MKAAKINGTNFNKATFHSGNGMEIHFNDGSILRYLEVPEGIFEGLKTAEAPGSFLHRYVRDQFNSELVKACDTDERMRRLEHHHQLTVGMVATDRPEKIPFWLKRYFIPIEAVELERPDAI